MGKEGSKVRRRPLIQHRDCKTGVEEGKKKEGENWPFERGRPLAAREGVDKQSRLSRDSCVGGKIRDADAFEQDRPQTRPVRGEGQIARRG